MTHSMTDPRHRWHLTVISVITNELYFLPKTTVRGEAEQVNRLSLWSSLTLFNVVIRSTISMVFDMRISTQP